MHNLTAKFRIARDSRYPEKQVRTWFLVPFEPEVDDEMDDALVDLVFDAAEADFSFDSTARDPVVDEPMHGVAGVVVRVPWDAEPPPGSLVEMTLGFCHEPIGG